MNIQVVAALGWESLWTSWSLFGSLHDLKAARVRKIVERIDTAALYGLGEKGCVRLSNGALCPVKRRGEAQWKRTLPPSRPGPAHLVSGPLPSSRTATSCIGRGAARTGPGSTGAVPVLQLREAG